MKVISWAYILCIESILKSSTLRAVVRFHNIMFYASERWQKRENIFSLRDGRDEEKFFFCFVTKLGRWRRTFLVYAYDTWAELFFRPFPFLHTCKYISSKHYKIFLMYFDQFLIVVKCILCNNTKLHLYTKALHFIERAR